MTQPRWTQRPPGSTWGDFGPDDQLGRVNLLTEAQVLKGVAEVRVGKTFCLSLPLDLPGGQALNPRRRPPRLAAMRQGDAASMNIPMTYIDPDSVDLLCDDQVQLSLQYSTQWDALAHLGANFDTLGDGVPRPVYYNGYRAGEDVIAGDVDFEHHDCDAAHPPFGARRLGIEHMAAHGMQGRGVMVDLARHLGSGRTLVGHALLQSIIAADGITIEAGDMLVLRTGFSEAIVAMQGRPDAERLHQTGAVLDGRDPQLLDWISSSGIATICTDNYAVEAYPARPQAGPKSLLPLHHHCLFKLGLPLAELWYLADLAAWLHEHDRHRFLLTAPPLRLPGAVGSPVTPVATV